ncbi:MAG: hypothetical protein APF80_07155 [Alphaproteobacteria bacterium BRH_c36]|nr:MAG: hypothetical protein APF80_07155 [Alphaproteobacteria bacterium BRH_c36]
MSVNIAAPRKHAARAGIALFAVAAGAIVATTPAPAQQATGSLIVVFDSSGSMWGNLPGSSATKFELARAALAESLPRTDSGVKTGLVTFGPGCSSINVATAPGLRNGSDTVAPLQTLNPKSKGPVVAAIEQTTSLLEDGQPAALLLVADGPDNCGRDLCALAQKIAGERPGMKIHTIGLGIEQAPPDLACASSLTKGRYFSAASAPDVATAIAAATDVALLDLQIQPKPRLVEKPALAQRPGLQIDPKGAPHLSVSAILGSGGETVAKPVRWRLYRSSSPPEPDALPVLDVLEPRFAVPMAAGEYYIKASLGRAKFGQAVKIGEAGASNVQAVFDAGIVKFSAAADQQAASESGAATLITVRQADDTSRSAPLIVSPYPEGELILPAGRYEIEAASGTLEIKRVIDVAAGARQEVKLALNAGELVLSAQAPIAGVQAKNLEFTVSVDDPDRPGGRRQVARSAAQAPVFDLPAATYYVEVRSGLASTSDRIALGAGKRVEKSLILEAGRLDVETDAPLGEDSRPQPIVYKLYQLDPLRALARSSQRSPSFVVAPGRYRIVAEIGARNVKAAEEIQIVAGQAKRVSLGVLAGDVRLNVSNENGTALGGQFWEVIDAAGSVVWRTQQRSPRGLLAPGRYSVRCETRKGLVEGTFEVTAGDTKTVEFRVQ